MTSIVKRYFHIRGPQGRRGKYNGATVLVVGDLNNVAQVDVQVAFCSRKDSFTRSIGRTEANKSTVKIVPLRYLPLS